MTSERPSCVHLVGLAEIQWPAVGVVVVGKAAGVINDFWPDGPTDSLLQGKWKPVAVKTCRVFRTALSVQCKKP